MKRTFKEFPAFSSLVRSGQISDEQVRQTQEDIMAGGGDAIPGTGGVRKIRCRGHEGGKRGGWRILFADYERFGLAFLIWAFPKGGKATLTAAEKNVIRKLKRDIDREVEASYGRRD